MKQTERNFCLDLAICVALLITTITGFILWFVIPHNVNIAFLGFSHSVWEAAHVYSGVVGLAGIVRHIVWHRGWLKALRGRRLRGMPEKVRANRVVDRIMWITYIAANVLGAMAWALHFGDEINAVSVPDRLHVVFGLMWIVLVIAHLVLHWKWVTFATRCYIVPSVSVSPVESDPANVPDIK